MTPQQLAYNAYGAYLGHKIICTPYADKIDRTQRDSARRVGGVVIGIEQSSVKVWCHDIYGVNWDEPHPELFKYVKLQLKPLSSITDEDAIYVANNVTNTKEDKLMSHKVIEHRSESGIVIKIAGLKVLIIYATGNVGVCAYDNDEKYFWNSNQSLVIDYLRSKGYNLPFMGYDLVKEGIAELIES